MFDNDQFSDPREILAFIFILFARDGCYLCAVVFCFQIKIRRYNMLWPIPLPKKVQFGFYA